MINSRSSIDDTADRLAEILEIDPEKVRVDYGRPSIELSYGAMRRLLILAEKGLDRIPTVE